MKIGHIVAFSLAMIGALNWGLVGLGMLIGGADWNLVRMILRFSAPLEAVVYILVGASAIWLIVTHKKSCTCCQTPASV